MLLARTGLMGCGRPEPSSPVDKMPLINANETPLREDLINLSAGVGGPALKNDPVQPISNQGGNRTAGERPKENADGGQNNGAGDPILSPTVGPKGSLATILKDGSRG